MKLNRGLLLIMLFTLSPCGHAAIEGFGDQATVGKLFLETPSYRLDLKPLDGGTTLKYQPHVEQIMGVSVAFPGLFAVQYGFRSPLAEDESSQKGKTIYDDFRFSGGFDGFNFNISFQSFKGFFIENTSAFDPAWAGGDPYYQDPEMKLENLSADFTYVLSPADFVLPAITEQTLRQTESAGSFILGGSLGHTQFSSSQGILPPPVRGEYGDEATLNKASFLGLHAKGGYGYNLIFKKYWYVGLAGLVNVGGQLGSFKTDLDSKSQVAFSYGFEALGGLGFNGDTMIGGLLVQANSIGYDTDKTDVNSSLVASRIFIGGRF